jgi:dienelactone hydrolase
MAPPPSRIAPPPADVPPKSPPVADSWQAEIDNLPALREAALLQNRVSAKKTAPPPPSPTATVSSGSNAKRAGVGAIILFFVIGSIAKFALRATIKAGANAINSTPAQVDHRRPASNKPVASNPVVAPTFSVGDPTKLFSLNVPPPKFPQLGPATAIPNTNVKIYHVNLGSLPGNSAQPAGRMQMRVYMPAEDLVPRSCGCVLVAPAGTIGITGSELDRDDYHLETLPYALAGYVVIHYSLDGTWQSGQSDALLANAYRDFCAADAGMLNARNAFLLACEIPAVDPARIYAAGHSSAANVALLFAEHEPRLAGCIAYAAPADLESRMQALTTTPGVDTLLPNLSSFLMQASPLTHLASLQCPVFLFHARDDSNVPFATSVDLSAKLLAASHREPTLQLVDRGDHSESMIREGVPLAIAWLHAMESEQSSKQSPQPAPR